THFTMSRFAYGVNQELHDGSRNPQFVLGADAGLTGGVKQDWASNTFFQSVGSSAYEWSIPLGLDTKGKLAKPSVKASLGIGISGGKNSVAVSFGLQAGAKISNLATSVTESISLTDNEADAISDATDVLTESWILVDKKLNETSGRWEANVATR